jgi:hypothetical protein
MSVELESMQALQVKQLTFQIYEKKCIWTDFPWKGENEKTITNHEANYYSPFGFHDANQRYSLFPGDQI